MSERVAVVGAGIFGTPTAIELRRRGYDVSLFDPGPIPHPLAASTDISKICRLEYGPDETYMALMEETLAGWYAWNDEWVAEGIGPLFHETGVLMICRDPMAEGGFEYESWQCLTRRGHQPERLDADVITTRFAAWSTGSFVDGFYHAKGGYAESGRVVEALAQRAASIGVDIQGSRKIGA